MHRRAGIEGQRRRTRTREEPAPPRPSRAARAGSAGPGRKPACTACAVPPSDPATARARRLAVDGRIPCAAQETAACDPPACAARRAATRGRGGGARVLRAAPLGAVWAWAVRRTHRLANAERCANAPLASRKDPERIPAFGPPGPTPPPYPSESRVRDACDPDAGRPGIDPDPGRPGIEIRVGAGLSRAKNGPYGLSTPPQGRRGSTCRAQLPAMANLPILPRRA